MTSRAQVKFDANNVLVIEGRTYRVAEHPALPGIPYVQRGGRGFVVQLVDTGTGERFALKYFKIKYRVPSLVQNADALRRYAELPGLKAANRTVFTRTRHSTLLNQYPALEYGVIMPWLPGTREGMTWYDIVAAKAPLNPGDAIRLAQQTARVLSGLEERGLAHCDIAGANVMVDRRAALVELVDIEEMYGSDLPPPVEPPGGQDGYQHPDGRQHGQWRAEGDRLAGAIIMSEMLGWGSKDIRGQSADEHYFATAEMGQPDSGRYKLLDLVLKEDYSPECADLLARAWRAPTLADCPRLVEWRMALEALKVDTNTQPGSQAEAPASSTRNAAAIVNPPSAVVSGRRMIAPPVQPVSQNGVETGDANPVVESASAVPAAIPASKAITSDRLKMAGVQLCRNCGAENPTGYSFCKKCGFYAGTVDQRKAAIRATQKADRAAAQAVPGSPISARQSPAKVMPPSPVALVAPGKSDIVAATRQGDKRIEAPKPPTVEESTPPAGIGAWLVVAVIFFIIAAVVLLSFAA